MTFIISLPLLTLRLIYSSLFKFHKVEAKAIDPTPFFSSYVGVWCHQSEPLSSTPLSLVCVFTLLDSPVIALLVGHLGRDECGRTHTSPGHPGLPGPPALRPLMSPAGLCLGCPPCATSWRRFQHPSQVLGCRRRNSAGHSQLRRQNRDLRSSHPHFRTHSRKADFIFSTCVRSLLAISGLIYIVTAA